MYKKVEFELHELTKIIDNYLIFGIKDKFYEKYGYLIPNEINIKRPTTIETIIIPADTYKLIEAEPDDRYHYQYWREFNVVWRYQEGNLGVFLNQGELSFSFWGIGYIFDDLPKRSFQYEIVDPFKFHLKKVQDQRRHMLEINELKSLFDYKSEYLKPNSLAKFSDVCRSKKSLKSFNDFNVGNDLFNSHRDIKNLIADLILFKPYLFDFELGRMNINGKTIYSYFPSFYDNQYILIASNIFQSLYNFWDKIGDLLFLFFDIGLKEDRVYFSKVMDKFPKEFRNENFQWLYNFSVNEYRKLNSARREIVHYQGLDSKLHKEFMDGNRDGDKMKELIDWRDSLVRNFKVAFRQTIIGFEYALRLIESKSE